MDIRILGAFLIIAGCGIFGFTIAASYVYQEKCLKEFLNCLRFMRNDLEYRLTPLPELCRCTALQTKSLMRRFFTYLAQELEDQIAPDAGYCVTAALNKVQNLPDSVRNLIRNWGRELGRFDAAGQINSIENSIGECSRLLEKINGNKESKIRNYKTLSLCAGAALAILFI